MKITEILNEDGRIVKGVNTTVDVSTDEIKTQAAKFGNTVDKDGRPPTLSTKVKGKSTNVLFNLGLAESVNHKLFTEALGEIASSTEIYVDMDGVLADFFEVWAKIMGVDHWTDIPKQYNIEDALEKIRNTEDFWLNLPLTDNAKNLLNLIKQVKGSYKILSSPLANDPRCEEHKKEWVSKNLGFFPPEEVIISHNKAQYAKQADGTPNILIDDYGVNIRDWEAAGGYGFKHKDHKFERTASAIKQHMDEPASEDAPPGRERQVKALKKKFDDPGAPYAIAWAQHNKHGKPKKKESVKEGIKLQFQRGDDFDTLHIKPTGKNRVELRGKPGYESGGYDAQDKLHQVLDKLGKAANFAELMNGEVVSINPKHPDGDRAKKTAQDILSTENTSPQMDPKAVEFELLRDAEKRRLAGEYKKLGPEMAVTSWGAALAYAVANYLGAQHLSQLELTLAKQGLKLATENFADGKKKGKSRPGRVKRAGASCNGSVTSLRKRAKNASGEKAKMYHWCANMKSGRKKK